MILWLQWWDNFRLLCFTFLNIAQVVKCLSPGWHRHSVTSMRTIRIQGQLVAGSQAGPKVLPLANCSMPMPPKLLCCTQTMRSRDSKVQDCATTESTPAKPWQNCTICQWVCIHWVSLLWPIGYDESASRIITESTNLNLALTWGAHATMSFAKSRFAHRTIFSRLCELGKGRDCDLSWSWT